MIRYYGHSLWVKLLRAVLRNSANIFNANSFASVFSGLVNEEGAANSGESEANDNVTDGMDVESVSLYKEFRENRTQWLKTMAKASQDKLERMATVDNFDDPISSGDERNDTDDIQSDTGKSDGRQESRRNRIPPPKPPPDVSITAFDVRFDDEEVEENSDVSDAETVLEAPHWYDDGRRKRNNGTVFKTDTAKSLGMDKPDIDKANDSNMRSHDDDLDRFTLHEGNNVVHQLKGSEPSTNTTVVATVTEEKRLHVLSNDLKDVFMEEQMYKTLCTQTNEPKRGGSVTTVETALTKRRHCNYFDRASYRQAKSLPLLLEQQKQVRRRDRRATNRCSGAGSRQLLARNSNEKTVKHSGLKPCPAVRYLLQTPTLSASPIVVHPKEDESVGNIVDITDEPANLFTSSHEYKQSVPNFLALTYET